MSDLQLLHQLQELDLQIEAQNRSLQEVESSLGESSELVAARARTTQLQEALHEQERRLRDLEWNVQEIAQHAQQDEHKLYSGTIHNPKELDGLRRDLEQRQAKRRALEDQELLLMAEVEATQASLKQAQERQVEVEGAANEKHRDLVDRLAELKDRLTALSADRARLAAAITAANLRQYEQLRRDKRGRAVSKIERSTCQGCRIALPMGIIQRVRSGRDLVYCPSCGRILYA